MQEAVCLNWMIYIRAVSVAESPDIICVVETWLSNSISDYEIVLPGYQCVRCDRDRHGGGVLMYIKSFFGI